MPQEGLTPWISTGSQRMVNQLSEIAAILGTETAQEDRVPGIADFLPREGKLVLHDLSANPLEWHFMIEQMQDLFFRMEVGSLKLKPVSTRERLRIALDQDKELFKSKYANAIYTNVFEPKDPRNGKTYGQIIGQ